jgi:hypothetical protein
MQPWAGDPAYCPCTCGLAGLEAAPLSGELLAFGHVEISKTIATRAIQEIELSALFGKAK